MERNVIVVDKKIDGRDALILYKFYYEVLNDPQLLIMLAELWNMEIEDTVRNIHLKLDGLKSILQSAGGVHA